MEKRDFSDLWIFAEVRNGKLLPGFYELLSKGKEISEKKGYKTVAVLLGDEEKTIKDELAASGVDKILIAKHEKLRDYNPDYYAAALVFLVRKHNPDGIWISLSAVGAELAPTVAGRIQTGLVAHAVDAYLNEDGDYVLPVPAFGGKMLSEELVPERRPVMASFKAGLFEKKHLPVDSEVQILTEEISELDGMESGITLLSVHEAESDAVPLDKAQLVVCGGLGAASEETWGKLTRFADRIGAAVGYTRPVVDMGTVPDESGLIGTSGKTISPELYIGFAVSGASHHMFGIKNSRVIISVNTDEKAEIFGASNGKGIADCDAVLDALLRETEAL